MNFYLTIKTSDHSVTAAHFQATAPETDSGHEAIQVSEPEYAAFAAYIHNDEIFNDKIMIYEDGSIHYIDRPTVPCEINKTTITADGADAAIISNLPENTLVIIDGVGSAVVTDGEFVLTTKIPRTYEILVKAKQYKDKEYTIHAV